jgi:hypothetical protein
VTSAGEGPNPAAESLDARVTVQQLRPVVYRGELVARAGRIRFHLLAPWLDGRPESDRELRVVVMFCLYHRQVLRGLIPDSLDPEMAERRGATLLEAAPELG